MRIYLVEIMVLPRFVVNNIPQNEVVRYKYITTNLPHHSLTTDNVMINKDKNVNFNENFNIKR